MSNPQAERYLRNGIVLNCCLWAQQRDKGENHLEEGDYGTKKDPTGEVVIDATAESTLVREDDKGKLTRQVAGGPIIKSAKFSEDIKRMKAIQNVRNKAIRELKNSGDKVAKPEKQDDLKDR